MHHDNIEIQQYNIIKVRMTMEVSTSNNTI